MNNLVEETRLTDEGFWDHFWSSLKVPSRVNSQAASDRCLSRAFLRFVPQGHGKRLVEIGAAPGRWLIFFRERLGYAVDGIEYIQSACKKTEENLAECGVEGKIFQQDFFQNDLPKHSYDVVLSLGFIEHFTNLDLVVANHIALLKPSGLLVLGVPNLRGIHGIVERFTDPKTLAAHNLNVMSTAFMKSLTEQHELTSLWIGYVGGLEPGLISVAKDKARSRDEITIKILPRRFGLFRFIQRLLGSIRNRIALLDHFNSAYMSGYLLAIYRYTPHK